MNHYDPSANRMPLIKFMLVAMIGIPFVVLFWFQNRDDRRAETSRERAAESKSTATVASDHATGSTDTSASSSGRSPTEAARPSTDSPRKAARDTQSEIEAAARKSLEELAAEKSIVKELATNSPRSELLAEFGGEEWAEIQEVMKQVELTSQPSAAMEMVTAAKDRLSTLLSALPSRKALSDLKKLADGDDGPAFLLALSKAGDNSALSDDDVEALWKDVENWPGDRWFKMCQSELKTMAPDDSGFADIWLAIADYHTLSGNEVEARTSVEKAWTNSQRMTNVGRAMESGIDAFRRRPESASKDAAIQSILTIADMCASLDDRAMRSMILAELSGMAHAVGDAGVGARLMADADTAVNDPSARLPDYMPSINRFKALARYGTPEEIIELIPKGEGRFPENAIGYAYAAIAAARKQDAVHYHKACLLAEIQISDRIGQDSTSYLYSILGQSDLIRKNWRRALIVGSNIESTAWRTSVVFPVMINAPDELPYSVGIELLAHNPTNRYGARAVAIYIGHHLKNSTTIREVLQRIQSWRLSSARAAAYLALARASVGTAAEHEASPVPASVPSLDDPRSLLEAAEITANTIQESIPRAYAQIWIAACWHKLDKPASYARACDAANRSIFQAWISVWRNNSTDSQHNAIFAITQCSACLAEMQAFSAHDAERAVESVIDAARGSHRLESHREEIFARLRAVVECVRDECHLPPRLLESHQLSVGNYLRMMLAASQSDLEALKQHVLILEEKGDDYRYNKAYIAARGFAELAIMAARNHNLDEYRAARRKTTSMIASQGAYSGIELALTEADALAGEFELAMKMKDSDDLLHMYGTVARPKSTLCVELCTADRWQDAEPIARSIREPFWKLHAHHAVSSARLQSKADDDPLQWATELEDQLRRVATYCGYATRERKVW